MWTLILTEDAIRDIKKAKNWYNKQQKNLGESFKNEIFKSFDDISKNPKGYASKFKSTRENPIKKFPYLVVYSIEEQLIFVLRVFPAKTNPKKKHLPGKK